VIGITDPEDFYPGIFDYYSLAEYGGQTAGLQNGRSIELMFYNADILTSAGISVPKTWEAYQSACISVTSGTVTGTALSLDTSRFVTWLWSRGGELLSADARHARFHQQPGIDSLAFFQAQIQDGYAWIPEGAFNDQLAFTNGETAFTFGSSAGIPYYRSAMDDGAGQAWGVARSPAVPGNEVVDFYGAGMGIISHSEEENRAAWLFLKWLTDSDQTARWAARSGYFPVRLSALEHISITQKLADDPQYAQAFDLQPLGKSEPGVQRYEAIRSVIVDALWQILDGGAEVTSTLQAAADQTDAILATNPSSSEITPAGGTVIYTDTQGLVATVEIPASVLAVTETISYVPLDDLPTDGLAFALLPDLIFSHPVTITLQYRDEDVVGMDEGALILYNYDWSTNSWVDADPCGGYLRDPENNILQARVCHFSDYAVFDWVSKNFLPSIIR
jgi:maltose-binding protein MalE